MAYAELHCHTNFSFLDGASSADDLLARAAELGLAGLAVTDHAGLYGVVRFVTAAEGAGVHPIVGVEVELADPAAPDPGGLVVPPRRERGGRRREAGSGPRLVAEPVDGLPGHLRSARPRLPGHRPPLRADLRGIPEEERGPHLVLLARSPAGYRSLCRLISRANLAGTKGVPRLDHALLEAHTEGLVALSGCRHGEIARRLVAGDRAGARAAAERYARAFGTGDSLAAAGFVLELEHHLLPADDWRVAETVDLAETLGLPVVVTNDVHYARPEDRELHDVLTAIHHGRTLDTLGPLRSPSGECYLKSEADLAALPPASGPPRVARAWRAGMAAAAELAASCQVDLGFEQVRFPGFPVPAGETPFSYLSSLCWEGARRRYHPLTPAVVRQLAHELEVIDRTGLAEFFLICWDLMAFARSRGIPAQGRGSAADSIVAYVLGITRVDPIRHRLLFERFINEGRTTYPDVDIDFSAARREEVIQYVYERYGAEHTGMVCNVVTYRARSAVREVGLALGFPRPFVDRVAKAVETYDSVMVRRDLEADGGFAHLFRQAVTLAGDPSGDSATADEGIARRPAVGDPAAIAAGRGLVDRMGRVARPGSARSDLLRDGGRTDRLGRPLPHASVARLAPEPGPAPRGGSTVGWSDWERWLELCARLDGFPRHLSIHTGGMLVTAAPLIDIAPLERATMPGRVVIQYDKRDVETLKLIKLDLLGLGMLAAIDETLAWIEHDCGVCLDLDRLPEDIPEVYAMLAAADTVGVFQVESRAQMQTLPKSRPRCLDDLVVEVAIIRPGPIQGNAVHPYLRRRQGLEPVTYLHPSLEPILAETLGVILYQEQVMRIAIEVAGFSAAEADGFRRAMGTWRSRREMEKLHDRFVEGCLAHRGLDRATAEELFRQVAAFASFGFAKSHAAAFARTAYESAFLKAFYPAQFLVGLVNAQPMGFYPVEVLVNDAKRHGVAVLPIDVNASAYRTTTEWVGRPGWALAGAAGDDGSRDADPGEPLPPGCGITERPRPVRSAGCIVPSAAARERWAAESARGWGVRLGLGLVTGLGEEAGARIEAARIEGPFRDLVDLVERTGLPEDLLERLVRAGALDGFGSPRRALLWQLREVVGPPRRRAGGVGRQAPRWGFGLAAGQGLGPAGGRGSDLAGGRAPGLAAGQARGPALRLPPAPAPDLPPLDETERLGDAYAVLGLDPRRQVVELFRPALDRLGVVPNAALAERAPGRVRIAGLVVTRQHPMTAKGTVFLALEDETGMVNVTIWPTTWEQVRHVVRRHALLLVEGRLQREQSVVNVVARRIVPLVEAAGRAGGPASPSGVRPLGYAGLRRLG
jgi:error-prone DNA polymerase